MSTRCKDCDRPDCPALESRAHTDGHGPWQDAPCPACLDCYRHRVDWRQRAVTAETEIARLTAALAEARKPRWVDFCGNSLLLRDGYAVAEVKYGSGSVYWSADLAKPWARVATITEGRAAAEAALGGKDGDV